MKQDPPLITPLRPKTLDEFMGQEKILKRLRIMIQAARQRGEPLAHSLFCGPPGLGKTTLAHIIASEMGGNLITTSGPIIDKPGDLAGILTSLHPNDVLFIDEIHRLPKTVEEYLYSAMEDFTLDLMIDPGPSSRSIRVSINPFTLVGATTRLGLLTSPMRTRFPSISRLDHYDKETLQKIVMRAASLLHLPIDPEAALEIAQRSRGTPRIAGNLLSWVRDCSQTNGESKITHARAQEALEMLAVDSLGLDEMDIKLLNVMIDRFEGGPVGLGTLAVALSEEPSTLEEVYEPFLITLGLIQRTQRGRQATSLAYAHLRKEESL